MNNKSYGVFVNKMNRIISAVVLLALIGLGTFIMWWFNEEVAFVFLIYISSLAVMANVILDHFSFGGLCAKDGIELGFLKSALNGIGLLKHVVLTDMFIRMAWNMIVVVCPIVLGFFIMGYEFNAAMITLIFGLLFMELFGQNLGVMIGRHQTTVFIKGMTAGLIATGLTIADYLMVLDCLDENGATFITWAVLVIGAIAFVVTSFVTIVDVNNSLKKSYVG